MPINSPRPVEFRSIKQLLYRLNAARDERDKLISIDELDLPSWQRQLVWTTDDMGLLIFSIISNYPIGMIVLWKKPDDGIRVPIDGRQRLTAIREFAEGRIAIPAMRHIPHELHNCKYILTDDDEESGYKRLPMELRDVFDDYEPSIVEFDNVDEQTAMDIFVKLQGGKTLTKAEVRAALGGRLCDFVTDLTYRLAVSDELDDIEDEISRHEFFNEVNIRNTRKAHRNLADVMLHEYLYPGQDKHWTSLESMYLDKAQTLTESEMNGFRSSLGRFHKAVQIEKDDQTTVLPQLRSTFFILTIYKAWKELTDTFALPDDFDFAESVRDFERMRDQNEDEVPWINFTAALSNAGYAKNRIETRHSIFMSFIHNRYPGLVPKDPQRTFTEGQKIAIWDRADGQCEYRSEDGIRCEETFADFHDADADHIVKWNKGGPTTLENGRLLCQAHNRAP